MPRVEKPPNLWGARLSALPQGIQSKFGFRHCLGGIRDVRQAPLLVIHLLEPFMEPHKLKRVPLERYANRTACSAFLTCAGVSGAWHEGSLSAD